MLTLSPMSKMACISIEFTKNFNVALPISPLSCFLEDRIFAHAYIRKTHPIQSHVDYTLHPLFNVLVVVNHSTPNQTAPANKQTPLQIWTPRKSISPFLVRRRAPAIGLPISVAMLETLQDIPSRVPSRDRSGQIAANAAEGSVTRPAERNPRDMVNSLSLAD